MSKKYHFLSGLPRSGSTLLASIMNQHPDIHVSATSALLDLLVAQANAVQFNRALYDISETQEIAVYNFMMDAYYKHVDKINIFDKHRAWPNLVGALQKMGKSPKIICTNRSIPEIITSYITLIDKNPDYPNYIDELVRNKNLEINTHNRAMVIWSEYVQLPYSIIKNAVKNTPENLIVVNYDSIINDPLKVTDSICKFFEIEPYDGYDFNNIVNNQVEKDDNGWKIKDLHKIRPELKKVSKLPEQVLGKTLTEYFSQFNLIFN